jgi:hypothetical protein
MDVVRDDDLSGPRRDLISRPGCTCRNQANDNDPFDPPPVASLRGPRGAKHDESIAIGIDIDC